MDIKIISTLAVGFCRVEMKPETGRAQQLEFCRAQLDDFTKTPQAGRKAWSFVGFTNDPPTNQSKK